jgi:hypothetical protein
MTTELIGELITRRPRMHTSRQLYISSTSRYSGTWISFASLEKA